ncbi:hypothetical protein Tco_1351551 [Tanacetum coccineum]
MFQQHQGESLSEAWTRFKDLLQKVPHHGIDLWLQIQIFYDHVNPITRRTIDQAAGGKLRDKNDEESWALLEDLALYDNESWNDPRDFAKPVKAISMPHDVPSTSDRHLIELENQICSGSHDTQYCIENPKQAFVDYVSSQSNGVGGKPFATHQGPRTFNDAAHAWKDKPNFGWECTQTFMSLQRGSMSTYSSNTPYRPPTHLNNLEKMMNDFDSHQEKQLSSLRTQFQQQQDDISKKLNTLLKMCLERFNNNPAHNTTHANVLTSCQFEGTEPRNKEVIKSPTKLLSPKYQEQPSLITIDEKTPPPRRVHFVNIITLVKKGRESRDTTLREHEGLTSEVDDEVGGNELEEEEEDDLEYFNTFPSMKELKYHEWLLKNPRPPWVKAIIRTKNLNNIKISCMIGHNLEKQVYIDFESPINVMSRRHYKQIMSQKLESRQKPSNLYTTSIIDHDLGEIAFGKPFIEETGLAYNKEEGTIVFRKNDEKITFKMPHKMEMFGHIDLKDMNTDPIPPFVLGDKNEHGKVYYSNSLIIGPEYKQNESVSKEIRCLINLEREARNQNGGVTNMTPSLAKRLSNKQKRLLGGNLIF